MGKKINRKRLIIMLTTVIMLAVVSVGMVIAYLTDSDSKNNKMTAGENVNELNGNYEPPESQIAGDEGNTYQKEVTVTNTGNVSCFVRVYVDLSDSEILDKTSFSVDGTTFLPANPNNESSFAKKINENNDSKWAYISDDANNNLNGYYYYKKSLKPGESTEPLFKKVKTTDENDADVKQYEIITYSETVQTKNENGADYSDYKTAWDNFLK